MALPLPEPTAPHHDAVFEQLKTDLLDGLKQLKAGEFVTDDEMRKMFRIAPEPQE